MDEGKKSMIKKVTCFPQLADRKTEKEHRQLTRTPSYRLANKSIVRAR